jgi:predicted cation transporter
LGLVHAAKDIASTLQRKVTPAVASEKPKDAVVFVVALGGAEVIVGVAGGVDDTAVRICHVSVATPLSRPRLSRALTLNVCAPRARPEYVFGLVHAAKDVASALQRKVTPAVVSEKVKLALVDVVVVWGLEPIVGVAGGVGAGGGGEDGVGAWISHDTEATPLSSPPLSRALTSNECCPTARPA